MEGHDAVAWRSKATTPTIAEQTRAFLADGGVLPPLRAPVTVPMDPGEYAVGYFSSGLWYARYYGTAVHNPGRAASVWIGSPEFVAGALVGATAIGMARRGQARRAAAPQWRPEMLLQTIVTTRRLWCELQLPAERKWTRLGYDAITEMTWRHGGVEVQFRDSPALRLTGEQARWCAVVIAHYRSEVAAGLTPRLVLR